MDELRNKEGKKAVIVAVSANLLLTILNIIVGHIGGSYALTAEGLHTFSDIITTVITYVGFKIGQKPADKKHPLGYGRAEAISGLLILLFLTIMGYGIIHDAIEKILNPHLIHIPNVQVVMMAIVGIIVNFIVSTYIINKGRKIKSPAIEADGMHQRADVYSSISILIGVIFANAGFPIVDPAIGLVIGLLILKTAYRIGKDNIEYILGTIPDEKIIIKIENAVKKTQGADDPHNIRIDNFGAYFIVYLHIRIDGELSLNEAHKIMDQTEINILKIPEIKAVFVHPCPMESTHNHKQKLDE